LERNLLDVAKASEYKAINVDNGPDCHTLESEKPSDQKPFAVDKSSEFKKRAEF
jgi:hypothetical protein